MQRAIDPMVARGDEHHLTGLAVDQFLQRRLRGGGGHGHRRGGKQGEKTQDRASGGHHFGAIATFD
jgi:hypothetical protein